MPIFRDFKLSRRDSDFNRRDCVVVRASASQSVDLEFIPLVESYQNTLKIWYSPLPCLAFSIKKG